MDGKDNLYENIGLKVVEQWSSDHGDFEKRETAVDEVCAKLNKIIGEKKHGKSWLPELKQLVDTMNEADFATHGKKICLYLLDKHSSGTNSGEHMKNSCKTRTHKTKKQLLKQKVVPRKIERRDSNDYLCTKVIFPRWLPSICNDEN